MDAALLVAARACIPRLDDDISTRRLRLPARMFGGGIRTLAALAPVAFAATVCGTVQRLIDRRTERGDLQLVFLPALCKRWRCRIVERRGAFPRARVPTQPERHADRGDFFYSPFEGVEAVSLLLLLVVVVVIVVVV